jgi:hypothetical protein
MPGAPSKQGSARVFWGDHNFALAPEVRAIAIGPSNQGTKLSRFRQETTLAGRYVQGDCRGTSGFYPPLGCLKPQSPGGKLLGWLDLRQELWSDVATVTTRIPYRLGKKDAETYGRHSDYPPVASVAAGWDPEELRAELGYPTDGLRETDRV